MPVRLFVGNLPYNATEAELREHFSAVGPVSYLSLPVDRESGQLRGFAFIDFNDQAQADDAIHRFNNQLFKGRPIAVSVARARDDRPPSGGSPPPSAPRTGSPRLNLSRPNLNAESDVVTPPAPGSKRSRDFGPDASLHSPRTKGKGGLRPERGSKGPMREMVRGQFFGGGDDADDLDDDVDDFYDDADDLHDEEPEEESNEENLAGHRSDLKTEDDK